MTPEEIEEFVQQMQNSKKYREAGISAVTIRDILLNELDHHKKPKDAVQAARKKLHEVIAPYLGDPNYERAEKELEAAFASGNQMQVKYTCIDIMRTHHSTEERLPLLDSFYQKIFAVTGEPSTLLDVACALNPLTFLWMGLPNLRMYAYDIHQQRIDFLNRYFEMQGIAGAAILQDILVDHPQEVGEVALLLKETARLEKRQRGITRPLLDALQVRWIVLSLPAHSRTGRRDLKENYQGLFDRLIEGRTWDITEIEFENELVYCIDKG
jgi:16S rRNA (guanine(1405)-N(7))-methyltransferase